MSHSRVVFGCTVITVCKDNYSGLLKTISSLFELRKYAACYNFQFILIDGASNDGSYELAEGSKIFDVLIHEHDEGIYDAMNKGIYLSKGHFTIFCNSGDMIDVPNFDAFLKRAFKGDCYSIWHGGITHRSRHDYFIKARTTTLSLYSMPTLHPATLYPTCILRKYPFDASYKIAADFKQLRLMYRDNIIFNRVNLSVSIFEAGGISNSISARLLECRRALHEMSHEPVLVYLGYYLTLVYCNVRVLLNRFSNHYD